MRERVKRRIGVWALGWGSLVTLATLCPGDGRAQVEQERVADGVWRIDGAVDVIVAQVGPDGLLMVDTGYPFAEAGVRAALTRVSGTDTPQILINTHWHHTFSNYLYAGEAEVIAHEAVRDRMGVTTLMAGQIVPPAPAAGRPTLTFSDSLTIHFNGEDITLIHLPGAHTDGDLAVFFRGSNVLLAGDVVVPHMPWSDINAGGDVAALIQAVDMLLEMVPPDVVIVPGHDRTMSYDELRAFRDMLYSARETVGERKARGVGLREIQDQGLPALAEWRGEGVPEALFLEGVYQSLVTARTSEAPARAYLNGSWLEAGRFSQKTMYSVDGRLTENRPPGSVESIDLDGGWVVPPFGEAHTHRLSGDRLEGDAEAFLDAGIFYVMVQDPSDVDLSPHRTLSARDQTPDVVYPQGVVTPSWGFVPDMYSFFADQGRYGAGQTLTDLEGRVLFTVDDEADLALKWPQIEANNPDVVKVIVAFADELEERRADPQRFSVQLGRYSAKPGLTESVLRSLVERAHGSGRRVSAHIETASDFRLAVDAGVDFIAHAPASWQIGAGTGYADYDQEPWLLTIQDAYAARRARTQVITTMSQFDLEDWRTDQFLAVHAKNLRTLVQAGATVMIGSDLFQGTSVDEVFYLRSLSVLDDAALFNLLAVQTPRAIFPDRKIGHLREGWEANFLVLGGNPMENLDFIRDIRLRVKQGWTLSPR